VTPERKYASGPALRTALEERLKRVSREDGSDLQRLRRQVAFDRFLAMLFRGPNTNWVLKGGYAMELRFQTPWNHSVTANNQGFIVGHDPEACFRAPPDSLPYSLPKTEASRCK
jgi:hypothetical protein